MTTPNYMEQGKKFGVDLIIGLTGVLSGLSLKETMAFIVTMSTIALIWVRIWLLIRNRDKNPKD